MSNSAHNGGILAFDLATVTGWAHATPAAVSDWPRFPMEAACHAQPIWTDGVDSGTVNLGGRHLSRGQRGLRVYQMIRDRLRLYQPAVVVLEAALPYHRSAAAARTGIGMAEAAHMAAAACCVPIFEAHNQAVKKHATGSGNAKKPEMIAAARALGFDPADDNEADALHVLSWAIAQQAAREAMAPAWVRK